MTVRWVRMAFGSFFMMCAAFAGNVFLFQPLSPSKPFSSAAVMDRVPVTTASVPDVRSAQDAPARDRGDIQPLPDVIASWKSPVSHNVETTKALQRELSARGYDAGVADGMPGLVTRASIMAYETDHGLPLTAEPSDQVLQHVLLGGPNRPKVGAPSPAGPEAERVIRTVQQSLANLGYGIKAVDGRMGEATARSIREFEAQQGLRQTGRISGQLVARLARLAGQGRIADSR